MKIKKKILLFAVSFLTICSSMSGLEGFVHAEDGIQYAFSEILNVDKSESTIELTIPKQENITVEKVILPDKSEVAATPNEAGIVKTTYKATENNNYDFEIHYTKTVKSDAVDSENEENTVSTTTLTQTVSYEVNRIEKVEEVKEEVIENSDSTKKVETKDLGKPTAVGTQFSDVEDNYGNWQYTIIDETNKKVEVNGVDFTKGSIGLENATQDKNISRSDIPWKEIPGTYMYKYSIPSKVMYNGEEYTVTRLGDVFFSRGGSLIQFGEIVLPDTMTEIGYRFAPYVSHSCRKVYVPDSVTKIGDYSLNFTNYTKEEVYVHLPKTASYGLGSLSGNLGYENITFSETEDGSYITLADYAFNEILDVQNVEMPRSLKSIGNEVFGLLKELKSFSMWNTTEVGDTYSDIAQNNASANYLIKSPNKIDTATDRVYKMFTENGVAVDRVYYGAIDKLETTSSLTQDLTKNETTTFDISAVKSIRNSSNSVSDTFTSTDWIDGGCNYTITGNTSTNTAMNGDTLTIGSNETASSIKVKAISKFDPTKFIEFTINIKKEYVAQAISYSNSINGECVAKFETLQEAFDYDYSMIANYKKNSIDIEILDDLVIEETVQMSKVYSKNSLLRYITTAPKTKHSASGNPNLYRGQSSDGRAVLKRGPKNKGALIETCFPSTDIDGNISITNLVFNGSKSDGYSGDSLITVKECIQDNIVSINSNLIMNNVKLSNNFNVKGNGGAIRFDTDKSNQEDNNLSKIFLEDVVITDCETQYNGGGIYIGYYKGISSIIDVEITKCFAHGNGGAVASYTNSPNFINGVYKYNQADGNGGALYFYEKANLNGVVVTNNSAGNLGAGIYVSGKKANTPCTLSGKMQEGSVNNALIIKDNIDASTKGNLYLEQNVILNVTYNLNPSSEIGVTLEGVDENNKNRMEPGSNIGKWINLYNPITGMVKSSPENLQTIYRDTNSIYKGYIFAGYKDLKNTSNKYQKTDNLVWPETPLNFNLVDNIDNTKLLSNAEFTLYKCNDASHDHSKDSITTLVKDSTCWDVVDTITTDSTGKVDFKDLSTGQYMLVETKTPSGYRKVEGQYFINVNNSPNKVKPQSYWDRISIIKRGETLPPDLTIKLDNDNYFETGIMTNTKVFVVTFDANTGEGSMDQQIIDVGKEDKLYKNKFTKTGYIFTGWNTKKDGSGTSYADEEAINNIAGGNITLYAQWENQEPSYFIEVPKAIILKDDTSDNTAKQDGEVKIIKKSEDAQWYPDKDIVVRTDTNITLTNNKSNDTYDVSVFKSDNTQYNDSTSPLMTLNVKDDSKQSASFTLKTPISMSKVRNLYTGVMKFYIEFKQP